MSGVIEPLRHKEEFVAFEELAAECGEAVLVNERNGAGEFCGGRAVCGRRGRGVREGKVACVQSSS